MLLTTEALKDLVGTIALMALLSVAYGTVTRACARPWLGRSVLGTLFGVAAVLAIHDPIQVAPGVIVDLRNVPIAMAGAFLGPQGAGAAMILALAMRIDSGGAGTVAGCMGIAVAGSASLLWAWLHRGQPRRGLMAFLGLAGLTSTYVLSSFLVPSAVAWHLVTSVWPFLLPLHVLGIVVVGGLLEREKALVEAERRLARAAERDPLTGLLNRRGFAAAVARSARAGGGALLLIDLDHFKAVNDRWGHAAGDAVLREVGPRLTRALRGRDIVGRFGGEEFVVFLPAVTPRGAEDAARRLCEVVRGRPFAVRGEPALPVTASIGGAWTGGLPDLDALILRADAALYGAKAEGRDRCRFSGAVTGGDREGDDEFGAARPTFERRRAAA